MNSSLKAVDPNQPNDQPFEKARRKLKKLEYSGSIVKKMNIIRKIRELIMMEMIQNRKAKQKKMFKEKGKEYTAKDEHEDDNFQLGSDDITPIYIYIWMISDINNHHAQFNYIQDWKPKVC